MSRRRILVDSVDAVLEAGGLSAATTSPSPGRSWSSEASCPVDPTRTRCTSGCATARAAVPSSGDRPGRLRLRRRLRARAIAAVEETVDRIEERTKAGMVYTRRRFRHLDRGDRAPRAALIDQSGVGRRVRRRPRDLLRLRAGAQRGRSSSTQRRGSRPRPDRRRTPADLRDGMLPHLRADDSDAAILAAMDRIDEVATPENAARLEQGRQLNAVVGLIGAPLRPRGSVARDLPVAALRQGPGLPRRRRRSTCRPRRPTWPPHRARWSSTAARRGGR